MAAIDVDEWRARYQAIYDDEQFIVRMMGEAAEISERNGPRFVEIQAELAVLENQPSRETLLRFETLNKEMQDLIDESAPYVESANERQHGSLVSKTKTARYFEYEIGSDALREGSPEFLANVLPPRDPRLVNRYDSLLGAILVYRALADFRSKDTAIGSQPSDDFHANLFQKIVLRAQELRILHAFLHPDEVKATGVYRIGQLPVVESDQDNEMLLAHPEAFNWLAVAKGRLAFLEPPEQGLVAIGPFDRGLD